MDIFDLAITGGGPAGFNAALRAAEAGLRTVLIEKNKLGGVCLNDGCIPSKAMLHSAKLYTQASSSEAFGVKCGNVRFDLNTALARKEKITAQLGAGIEARLKKAGVTVINAAAHIDSHEGELFKLSADSAPLISKRLLICTGSRAAMPQIPGADRPNIFEISEVFRLRELPESAVIIGSGASGLEAADFLNQLGCRVTVIEQRGRTASETDEEISLFLQRALKKNGIKIITSCRAVSFSERGVECEYSDGRTQTVGAQAIFCATGRAACCDGLGTENIGLSGLDVNSRMQTKVKNVYAAGDVTGKSMLAHTAYREGEVAVNNMLGRNDEMDYGAVPQVIYTSPEAASVGETLESALAKGIDAECRRESMRMSGRFLAEEDGDGICKIIIDRRTGRILGMHIAGGCASELIYGAEIAISNQMSLEQMKKTIFPHPTVGEAIREVIFK